MAISGLPLPISRLPAELTSPLSKRSSAKIQEFDPVGVAARDLRESLLIQVRHLGMGGSLVEAILRDHLKDLETRKYKQIAQA